MDRGLRDIGRSAREGKASLRKLHHRRPGL